MNTGWKTEPLGELCEFQRGLTYSKGDEVEVSDNIVLRATNIDLKTNLLDFAELKYISDKVAVPDSKKVKKDSLMICTASGSKSHLGKVAYIDDDYDYAFGGFMGMITPKNGLVPKYLFHLMTSDTYKDFIGELSDGANINNLKFDDLKKFPVPHPKPDEQKRIIGILDKAFEGITTAKANAETNRQNAHDLFESHLQSVFTQRGKGWVEKPIAECFKVRSGDFLPAKAMVETGDFDVYGGNGVNGRHNQKNLTGRNIIIGRVGAKCGNVRCIEGDLWVTDNAIYISEYFREFDLGFLARVLDRKQLRSKANQAAQPVISYTTIRDVVLEFPVDVSTQKKIAEALDTLEVETQRLATLYEQKLAALDAFKKSLLHEAFAGKL